MVMLFNVLLLFGARLEQLVMSQDCSCFIIILTHHCYFLKTIVRGWDRFSEMAL